jgi:hypothetical protein
MCLVRPLKVNLPLTPVSKYVPGLTVPRHRVVWSVCLQSALGSGAPQPDSLSTLCDKRPEYCD